ncbi:MULTISPECIES: hypothetical protein [Actinomadura]|uniref:Uncharacterized protein n=1 Tax=Actinomadura yumaensis TaxID=111807 RepID=A0ABW2CYQ2_9ACTN|nr:hypothetical protein [Actinomadura sp. J1-007]
MTASNAGSRRDASQSRVIARVRRRSPNSRYTRCRGSSSSRRAISRPSRRRSSTSTADAWTSRFRTIAAAL